MEDKTVTYTELANLYDQLIEEGVSEHEAAALVDRTMIEGILEKKLGRVPTVGEIERELMRLY